MAFVDVRLSSSSSSGEEGSSGQKGSSAGEGFRWAGQQGAHASMFPGLVRREFGRGEFRGLEFYEVEARRIINEVPAASQVPFRFTINAYRGCSHACSYCTWGEAAVLMADGRTKPMREIRPGNRVYGTKLVGTYRRYVTTEVLDHWEVKKEAYRVRLANETELIVSGDHRLLAATGGWKHVAPEHRCSRHSYLGLDDELVGAGNVPRRDGQGDERHERGGLALKTETSPRVVEIEPLGVEMPMYDVTTGTGDYVADGVVHHNCFARPTHEYLNFDLADDFERKLVVKVNAVERLQAELAPNRWAGEHIAMGTNTDPYQRAEGKYRLTRGIVEVLSEHRNPFSILTKSSLILRDLDLLAEAAQRTEVAANFSIGTLDDDVWRLTEPGTPHPRKRVEAVAKLNEAGVRCGVLVAPILPGISDSEAHIDAVVGACVDAGARSVSAITLHLRRGVREHYLGWLEEHRPDLVPLYRDLYGRRAYAPKRFQARVAARVARAIERHGGVPATPGEARRVPLSEPPAHERAEQLGLAF